MHVIQCAPTDLVWCLAHSKIVGMIRKYYTHKLQTNLWHHKEEPHNNHETPGRQSSQLSLPYWDVWTGPTGDGETQVGLNAWWSTQSRLGTLLSSLIACGWVGLQTLWRFGLKYLSIDEMVGAWCFGCCQAHRGLPVGFLLLRYSVLSFICWVFIFALSPFYILIYMF